MGAYKRNVVVVIKMDAYIHGRLFCVGAYYPDFTVCANNGSFVNHFLAYLCTPLPIGTHMPFQQKKKLPVGT